MASHWMRELRFTQSPINYGLFAYMKFTYLFVRYVLGYSHVADSTGTSFGTYEKAGSNGVLVNSSFRFTDSTASAFVAGDVNKWILIVDSSNPENCGWYQINNYVDADNIDISFRTGATEYPTAATALTWYIVGETYDMPSVFDSYFRLRTPHADAWDIEFRANDTDDHVEVRVSLDQDWTAAGKVLGPVWGSRIISSAYNPTYYYLEGDSDGSYLHMICLYVGYQDMSSIVKITPWETSPAHSDDELWALMGHTINSGAIDRKPTTSGWGHLYIWRDRVGEQREGGVLEWSSNTGTTYGFTQYAAREANARTGKNDVMYGSHGITDSSNIIGEFEYLGLLNSHQSIRNNLSKMQTVDYEGGTKNRIHVADGIMLPWPGYTPQYTP